MAGESPQALGRVLSHRDAGCFDHDFRLESKFMCGRYRLSRRKEILAEHFGADLDDVDWEPRYNIAPTQTAPVVRSSGGDVPKVSMMRWGIVPSWAVDPAIGARTINARAETVASKPSFGVPFRTQRCLVPADAFYEWRRRAKQKQPFCFEVKDGATFAFAGLWDRWHGPDHHLIESFTILTTTPNKLMADVHERMPVILAPESYQCWLDSRMRDESRLAALLRPYDSTAMRRYPVGPYVNYVTNDSPECSMPFEYPALFDF